jgi:hypothetical protein
MDTTTLATLANAISTASPAIRKYAVEQVRVTKDQERRLARIAAVPLPSPLDPARPYTTNQLYAHAIELRKALAAIKAAAK